MKSIFTKISALMMVIVVGVTILPMESASALKYDPKADYLSLMKSMAKRGDRESLYIGSVFEELRNEKITSMRLKYKTTNFFKTYKSPKDIITAINLHKNGWTMDDLDLMARIINAEAGANWTPDWVQRAVGSVVINRVKDSRFPNTIREVIYQPGQYGPAWNGSINKTPTERSQKNALYILENGKTLPDGVIGQNGNPWGRVYTKWYDPVLGGTMYFHY